MKNWSGKAITVTVLTGALAMGGLFFFLAKYGKQARLQWKSMPIFLALLGGIGVALITYDICKWYRNRKA